jgi:hypothetical protein
MKENYKHRLYHWSKRFTSLLPYRESTTNVPVYLPRLMMADNQLPRFVRECGTTMMLIPSYRLLPWSEMMQSQQRLWFGQQNVPQVAYIGALMVKISLKLPSISHLRRFLIAHPALIWALGFPLWGQTATRPGFDPQQSVPTRQQFSRALRDLDNGCLQAGLTAQVQQLQALLPETFGQTVSLDTSHILAWVQENNPRQSIKEGRFNKEKQPAGDSDCKVGCKRAHNRLVKTPSQSGKAGSTLALLDKEFYWGYASGAVVTKVPSWGEFVLAEMTDTFDKADVRYFFPLMEQVEQRLGFRPRFAALDAAFDAFYTYDYFHSDDHDGFAAVPLKQPNAPKRYFDETGLPLCEAGLPMPVRKTYPDHTKAIMPHQRAIHACPLLHPQPTGQVCPLAHKMWPKGGCTANLPTTLGARLRHQLDRNSDSYKAVFKQRTAVERIFSQAKALGMERPKLRNQQAITNYNSMIYLLINLQAIERVLHKRAHG